MPGTLTVWPKNAKLNLSFLSRSVNWDYQISINLKFYLRILMQLWQLEAKKKQQKLQIALEKTLNGVESSNSLFKMKISWEWKYMTKTF